MLTAVALHTQLGETGEAPPTYDRLRAAALAEMSDHKLATAAAANDMPALGKLYERHSARVYAICLGMTRNSADAEDLTQEVFVSLVRKIGSYRGESQFTTWLHRLAVNCVLMHFRRPSRRENTFTDLGEVVLVSARLAARTGQLSDGIALRSAVARLPRGCRAVYELFEVAGYEHEEIARLLGCSTGTTKSQLHRARIKLRKLLSSN